MRILNADDLEEFIKQGLEVVKYYGEYLSTTETLRVFQKYIAIHAVEDRDTRETNLINGTKADDVYGKELPEKPDPNHYNGA